MNTFMMKLKNNSFVKSVEPFYEGYVMNKENNKKQLEGYSYLLKSGIIDEAISYEEFMENNKILKNDEEEVMYCRNKALVRSIKKK